MKYCSKCGKEIMDEAVVCPNCGCTVRNFKQFKPTYHYYDDISIGLVILSVVIPLFGIIYWCLKHNETPTKAKACGIAGIISWAVGILLSIDEIFSTDLIFSFGNIFHILEELI